MQVTVYRFDSLLKPVFAVGTSRSLHETTETSQAQFPTAFMVQCWVYLGLRFPLGGWIYIHTHPLIEPATFRLVAWCLKQVRYRVTNTRAIRSRKRLWTAKQGCVRVTRLVAAIILTQPMHWHRLWGPCNGYQRVFPWGKPSGGAANHSAELH
jgi:hypothetical protein